MDGPGGAVTMQADGTAVEYRLHRRYLRAVARAAKVCIMSWRVLFGAVLDVLLPAQCVTCTTPVAAAGQFCVTCFTRTAFLTDPCCTRCGVGFPAAALGGLDLVCEPCRQSPPPWTEGRAALLYDDQARRLIMPLKYADRLENARALAPHLARVGARLLAAADWVVPVPLHRHRLLSRRYNQAALLAQAVTRLVPRPLLLDAVVRTRATPPLGPMTPTRRQAVLAGAFMTRPARVEALRDSRVLLIDDILTTGSTAAACTAALLAAGVARVDVLVAARAGLPELASAGAHAKFEDDGDS